MELVSYCGIWTMPETYQIPNIMCPEHDLCRFRNLKSSTENIIGFKVVVIKPMVFT